MKSTKEFNTRADILMERLRLLSVDKKSIYLYNEINRLTLDVISNVNIII